MGRQPWGSRQRPSFLDPVPAGLLKVSAELQYKRSWAADRSCWKNQQEPNGKGRSCPVMALKDAGTPYTSGKHTHSLQHTWAQAVDSIASVPSTGGDKSDSTFIDGGTYCRLATVATTTRRNVPSLNKPPNLMVPETGTKKRGLEKIGTTEGRRLILPVANHHLRLVFRLHTENLMIITKDGVIHYARRDKAWGRIVHTRTPRWTVSANASPCSGASFLAALACSQKTND